MTAARKAREQIEMFQRRGADTMWAPALSLVPSMIDQRELRRTTQAVAVPTCGSVSGDNRHRHQLLVRLRRLVGTGSRLGPNRLRRRGAGSGTKVGRCTGWAWSAVDWSPQSECFADVLAYLSRRDLSGKRIVLQEHGQSLDHAAQVLRERGAEVVVASIYRVDGPESPARLDELLDLVVAHALDALTFTSAPAAHR